MTTVERLVVPGAGVDLGAWRFLPDAPTGVPILMIHENRGMVPSMVEVGAALADAGHEVVAPDLLTRIGGTEAYADNPAAVTTRQIDEDIHEADLLTAYDWMVNRHLRLAIVGFCFGGEMGWRVITRRVPEAAVLYYGIGPDPEMAPAIRCRVYAVYAQDDPRVNDTLAPLCTALSHSEVDVVLDSFPGTRHAFHDHTRPDRYHPGAAAAAWKRMLAFLEHAPPAHPTA